MKNLTKKIILSFVIIFCLVIAGGVYAQTTPTQNYSVLVPLPNITEDTCGNGADDPGCQTTLERYVPSIYRLAVGIAVALAFVMITLGGIMYATSDAITGKQQGRKYIYDAVIGLLLVIGSYIILYTINPNMLSFDLNITSTSVTGPQPPIAAVGCNGCVSLQGLPMKDGVNPQIAPNVLPLLQSLNDRMRALNKTWRITEAFSFGDMHTTTSCHHTGSCVDANPTDTTRGGLLEFYNAARSSGFNNVTYEVRTSDDQRILREGCPRCNPPVQGLGNVDWVRVNTSATERHFHIRP